MKAKAKVTRHTARVGSNPEKIKVVKFVKERASQHIVMILP